MERVELFKFVDDRSKGNRIIFATAELQRNTQPFVYDDWELKNTVHCLKIE